MRTRGMLLTFGCLLFLAGWSASGEEQKYTGTLGRAGDLLLYAPTTDTAAVLKAADATYYLKVADTAAQTLKDDLAKVVAGTLKGDYTVTGTMAEADGKKWVTVTSMTANPTQPPPPSADTGKKGGKKGGGGRGGKKRK